LPDTPRPETLREWDRKDLWHPFTPHAVYEKEHPLLIDRGEGNYLIDVDGNRYLDGVSSLWCNLLGHHRPEIDNAIRSQLDKIAHSTLLGNSNAVAVELAHRLVSLAPEGLTRVFFSDNGSTSVEVALKMAFQFWQQVDGGAEKRRTRFVALANAYHGDTLGSVSVGGIDLFHEKFRPMLFDVLRGPSPYCYRCPLEKDPASCAQECLQSLLELIHNNADELAGVVLEPGFQGAGGIIAYPKGYLRKVREATHDAGTFLVLDEVAAGMGRGGTLFACEQEKVVPDFLCIAKGLTGGYLPLAATLTTERVFEAFLAPPEDGFTFFHGHTYTGNALGAAAALATLDILDREEILSKVKEKIQFLGDEVGRLWNLPGVGDIRQWGMAAGVELVADKQTKEPFPASERRGMRVCTAAKSRGVFLRPLGDVVVVMPPLTITQDEIRILVDAVEYGVATEVAEAK